MTIMVLELKVPHGEDLDSLRPLFPVFISYVLSFIYLGIYWNNHHHLLQAAHHVKGSVLWANLHLLFWLSLIPSGTAWMGENNFAPWPVALYGTILFFAGTAYYILERVLVAVHDKGSTLDQALGRDFKTKVSIGLYLVAIVLAFRMPAISCALYVAVTLLWLIPDSRIEKQLVKPRAS